LDNNNHHNSNNNSNSSVYLPKNDICGVALIAVVSAPHLETKNDYSGRDKLLWRDDVDGGGGCSINYEGG